MSRKDLSTTLCVRCLCNWGERANRNDTCLSVLQGNSPWRALWETGGQGGRCQALCALIHSTPSLPGSGCHHPHSTGE